MFLNLCLVYVRIDLYLSCLYFQVEQTQFKILTLKLRSYEAQLDRMRSDNLIIKLRIITSFDKIKNVKVSVSNGVSVSAEN